MIPLFLYIIKNTFDMKINSELPMCLLSQNNGINEYDFVLFHLYISNKDYRNYYRNQRVLFPGRLMILDNSYLPPSNTL